MKSFFAELFVHTLQSTNKFKRRGQQNKKNKCTLLSISEACICIYSNLCKIDKFLLNWKWQKCLFPNILISMSFSYYTSVYNFTLHSWKLFHYVFVYAMHIRNKQIMRNTCFFTSFYHWNSILNIIISRWYETVRLKIKWKKETNINSFSTFWCCCLFVWIRSICSWFD